MRRFAAMLVIYVVSMILVLPSLLYRPLWRVQNRVVDWVETWGWPEEGS